MVKTATFESLSADARPDGDGTYVFVLEGKTYHRFGQHVGFGSALTADIPTYADLPLYLREL